MKRVLVLSAAAIGRLTKIQTVSRKDVIVNTPLVGIDRYRRTTVVWQESRRGVKRPFAMVAVARKGKPFGKPVALGRTNPPGELVSGPTLAVSSSGAAVNKVTAAWVTETTVRVSDPTF
jgi:hypothetical protein